MSHVIPCLRAMVFTLFEYLDVIASHATASQSISSRFRVDLGYFVTLLRYRTQSFLIQERSHDGILPQGQLG